MAALLRELEMLLDCWQARSTDTSCKREQKYGNNEEDLWPGVFEKVVYKRSYKKARSPKHKMSIDVGSSI